MAELRLQLQLWGVFGILILYSVELLYDRDRESAEKQAAGKFVQTGFIWVALLFLARPPSILHQRGHGGCEARQEASQEASQGVDD